MSLLRPCLFIAVLAVALPAFAGGQLSVVAVDDTCEAEGYVQYWRYNDSAGGFEELTTRPLDDGCDVLAAAAGVYQVKCFYTETFPRQEAISQEVRIEDGDEKAIKFVFGQARVRFDAVDLTYKGGADALIFVDSKEDGEYYMLNSMELSHREKNRVMVLPPGVYRVRMLFQGTRPQREVAGTDFVVAAGDKLTVRCYFRHSDVPYEVIDEEADDEAEEAEEMEELEEEKPLDDPEGASALAG
jgi:hypothetical protein